jgi:hypothetical protein
MRKLMVGLVMVVGLLGLTSLAMPAMADNSLATPGSLDPVGLITSGAVIPFLGAGLQVGGMSFLELLAPVTSSEVHMFLFDSACVRGGPSLNVPLTANDVALLRIDNIGAPAPTSGLITAASSDGTGFTLVPLAGPIAARVLWANSNGNFVRVIDPIALSTLSEILAPSNEGGWHPMRTSAAFFAPLESGGLHTTIYFVCPNTNIQRHLPTNGGALSPGAGFPIIRPELQVAGSATPLRVRVYDDEESLLRDVTSSCNCLTIKPVTDLDLVYASAVDAPNGTYTEVEGATTTAVPATCSTTVVETLNSGPIVPLPNANNACPGSPAGCTFGIGGTCTAQFQQLTPAIPGLGPFSFVAYRAITVPGFDVFGRVAGGSRCQIQGSDSFSCSATLNR